MLHWVCKIMQHFHAAMKGGSLQSKTKRVLPGKVLRTVVEKYFSLFHVLVIYDTRMYWSLTAFRDKDWTGQAKCGVAEALILMATN